MRRHFSEKTPRFCTKSKKRFWRNPPRLLFKPVLKIKSARSDSSQGAGCLFYGESVVVEDSGEAWTKVKGDALRLLAFKPRSTVELRRRLKLKKHPDELIEKALTLMTQQGLLNDEQFAKMFAVSRAQSRPMGRNRIKQDLVQKGVPARCIEEALASLDTDSERDSALELAQKRMRLMKGIPVPKQKNRLMGYLLRRGFAGDIVSFVMSACFKNSGDFE